jgi:hypothetical protein
LSRAGSNLELSFHFSAPPLAFVGYLVQVVDGDDLDAARGDGKPTAWPPPDVGHLDGSPRQLRVKFVRPPKLTVVDGSATVRFDLVNVGNVDLGMTFRLSVSGEAITFPSPSVHLSVGSGATRVTLELPIEAGLAAGAKVKVAVVGPGNTTLAASSTGAVSMNLPNGSNVSLSRRGLRVVAAAGIGSAVIIGTAIYVGNRENDPPTEEAFEVPAQPTDPPAGEAFEVPEQVIAAIPSSTGPDAADLYPFGTPNPIVVDLVPLGEPGPASAGSPDGVLALQEYGVQLSISSGPVLDGTVNLPSSVESSFSASFADSPIELDSVTWTQVDFIETGVLMAATCYVGEQLVAPYSAADGAENVSLLIEALADGSVGASVFVVMPMALVGEAVGEAEGCVLSQTLPQIWMTDR